MLVTLLLFSELLNDGEIIVQDDPEIINGVTSIHFIDKSIANAKPPVLERARLKAVIKGDIELFLIGKATGTVSLPIIHKSTQSLQPIVFKVV